MTIRIVGESGDTCGDYRVSVGQIGAQLVIERTNTFSCRVHGGFNLLDWGEMLGPQDATRAMVTMVRR